MGFEKVYVTKSGMALEAKARAGKELKLLRVEIGNGSLESANIDEQVALTNKIIECPINTLQEINNQTIINFILEQSKVDNGFYFREFGVIAQEPDTHEEVLYMYANAGSKAEYINDKSATNISDKIIDIIIKEDNTDNFTISIDSTGVFVGREEYQTKMIEIDNTKSNKKKTYNITIDTTWTGEEAPYTKTIAVQGILATDIVNMYPVWSDALETRQTEKEEYNKMSMINSAENAITLTCDEEKPNVALNVRLEVTY